MLIRAGQAYVDDLSADQIRETPRHAHRARHGQPLARPLGRGEPGPLRAHARGRVPRRRRVLRARIDMASPNINLRDPVLYRILHARHPRTGDAWCIYPTYDFAHGQSDAIEGVTHSICTLEFENHRPLYDWLIEHLPVPSRPHQYEFARLNLTWTVLSKRFLLRLVEEGRVRGWDDPRMPTIAGLRRRGFPAEAIRASRPTIGVSKRDARHRDRAARACRARRAQPRAPRAASPSCDRSRSSSTTIPSRPGRGARTRSTTPRTRLPGRARCRSAASSGSSGTTSWRTRPQKFFRLAPGREVRLRNGLLHHLHGGRQGRRRRGRRAALHVRPGDARRRRARRATAKATLHWVSAAHARPRRGAPLRAPLRQARPGRRRRPAGRPRIRRRRPSSRVPGSSPRWPRPPSGETVQFERLGYFCVDPDSRPGPLVFNRTLTLRDTWAKVQARPADALGGPCGRPPVCARPTRQGSRSACSRSRSSWAGRRSR